LCQQNLMPVALRHSPLKTASSRELQVLLSEIAEHQLARQDESSNHFRQFGFSSRLNFHNIVR